MFEEIIIHRNYRTEDEFKPEYCCDFCTTNFNTYLIKISTINKCICKGCLSKMSQMLDQAQMNNFQSDFDKARKEVVKYDGWEDEEC